MSPPKQQRSRATLERILAASEALLEDKPVDQIHVSEIVDRADASVGSFYARFRDKDGLLALLHQRFHDQVLAQVPQLLDPEPWCERSLEDTVEEACRIMVTAHKRRQGAIRAFHMRAAVDDEFRAREAAMNQVVSRGFSALLAPHGADEGVVDFAVVQLLGALLARVFYGPAGTGQISYSDREFSAKLTRAFLAQLEAR